MEKGPREPEMEPHRLLSGHEVLFVAYASLSVMGHILSVHYSTKIIPKAGQHLPNFKLSLYSVEFHSLTHNDKTSRTDNVTLIEME